MAPAADAAVGHQLNPRSDTLLTPAEVVLRLRAELAYVDTDRIGVAG